MKNNYSVRLLDVIEFSREEAQRLQSSYIGPEHLMLGIIREGTGKAIQALTDLHIDGQDLKRKIEKEIKNTNDNSTPNEISITQTTERVLRMSMADDPLFWIHLNVDYPFHLTGILYFPRIKSNLDLNRNKIQLYCNQVFVTDSVEGIVPEFLTLLHGVLDSPDIPLNVSRSYLQSDQNVKKISAHITKKVADRLEDIFKTDRKQYEEKWDSLKLFIQYGMSHSYLKKYILLHIESIYFWYMKVYTFNLKSIYFFF